MSRNYINELPRDMYRKTLLSLSIDDIEKLCLTDKTAYSICTDDNFWLLYLTVTSI